MFNKISIAVQDLIKRLFFLLFRLLILLNWGGLFEQPPLRCSLYAHPPKADASRSSMAGQVHLKTASDNPPPIFKTRQNPKKKLNTADGICPFFLNNSNLTESAE
ncbi:MAG: hypothetical protein PUA64_04230 [Treponema sp.]|nr:hypothetical protein [Treponema sp.]